MRAAAPVYSHGNIANMLDAGECRAWAQRMKQEPEGFTAFKFGFGVGGGGGRGGGRGGLRAAVVAKVAVAILSWRPWTVRCFAGRHRLRQSAGGGRDGHRSRHALHRPVRYAQRHRPVQGD